MVRNQVLTEPSDQRDIVKERQGTAGFGPSTVILVVAATCLLGLIWGAIDSNWVLVATETPVVLALLAVWTFARANRSGNQATVIASAIGALCAVELWIATAVLHASGSTLAVIVAGSTAATFAAGGVWALWAHHKGTKSD